MDKEILVQYCEMKEEIKDLRRRIGKLSKEIDKLSVVSDTVKGSRLDGTIGPIKITGFPDPRYRRLKTILHSRQAEMIKAEAQLSEITAEVEKYINSIEKSEIRMIFRLYYIDNLNWIQVAHRMNSSRPKGKKPYTEDSCRCKHNRYLEKN